MKTLTAPLLALLCATALAPSSLPAADDAPAAADDGTLAEVSTSLTAFMAEEGWSVKDVAEAVRTMRNLYKRETKTATGRARWHGKRTSVVTDAATGNVISTYEDGEVFVDAPKAATVRPQAVTTNGLPAAVASARRAAWLAKRQTNVVTRVITAGGAAR